MSTTMIWYFSKSRFGDALGLKRGLDTSSFHIMMTMVHKEQKEQHIWRLFINGSSGFYGLITSQQSNRGQVGVGGQNDSGSPNKETQRPNGDKLDKLLLDKRFLDKIICRFKLETNSVFIRDSGNKSVFHLLFDTGLVKNSITFCWLFTVKDQ